MIIVDMTEEFALEQWEKARQEFSETFEGAKKDFSERVEFLNVPIPIGSFDLYKPPIMTAKYDVENDRFVEISWVKQRYLDVPNWAERKPVSIEHKSIELE